jgi:hypothetical protein
LTLPASVPLLAAMRLLLAMVALLLVWGTGCFPGTSGAAKNQGAFSNPSAATRSSTTNAQLIVTPETAMSGKVVRTVSSGRFAVLNFPIGRMPTIEQRAEAYRQGLKVGDLRITGPQLDDNIVADILTGDVQPGDRVRVQ